MAENLFDLTGKVALVTGANSGLGLAMAEGLARAGADVVIWGRREDRNAAAAERLAAHGGRVVHRAVDVADEQAVIEAMADAAAALGRLDFVVCNAGFSDQAPFDEMTGERWHHLLATQLDGAFYTAREAGRHMKSRALAGDAGGGILMVGSLSSLAGIPNMAHYAAAKGAVNALSKSLAVDLGPYEVRINTICVGFIPTGMSENSPSLQPVIQATLARTPIKRLGTPEDLQGIAVYLASDLSRYHNADTITLDGGMMGQVF